MTERGESYLMAKEPEQAAMEYRKILDHPGVVTLQLRALLPFARVGLARAGESRDPAMSTRARPIVG